MRINIDAFPADDGGCGHYRVIQPYGALDPERFNVQITTNMLKERLGIPDIMTIQRQFEPAIFTNVMYAKFKGTRIIFELDDDLFHIEPTNKAAWDVYMTSNVQYNTKIFLNNADLVTVTTPYLKREMEGYTKSPVVVVKNCLDLTKWAKHAEKRAQIDRKDDRIIIGWAGSSSHLGDFRDVVEVILKLIKKYDNLYFKFVGQSFKEADEFKGIQDRILTAPWANFSEFGGNLADIDIGIIPLAFNKFNQSKSNIKFLEYGIMGIPTVASDIRTYSDDIRDGENGFLVGGNCASEWMKKIERLITDVSLRRLIGDNARRYVIDNYDLHKDTTLADILTELGQKKAVNAA